MTTCTATTAAGHPCKNHSVKGTQLCKVHGGAALSIRHGAPLANTNTNTVKHGFYRPTIRQDEYANLLTYAEQFDLASTHVRLRRLMTYIDDREDNLDPDQYCRLTALILNGGTKVNVIDQQGDWVRLDMPKGVGETWVPAKAVEPIT